MARKEITDWDGYFWHRQEVQYQWWKRMYDNHINASRNEEIAHKFFSVLMRGITLIMNPDKTFSGITINNQQPDEFEQVKNRYFERVYDEFKFQWQLRKDQPVMFFLNKSFPNLIREYYMANCDLIDEFDIDRKLKYQELSKRMVESSLGKSEVVNWIAFCFARERFIDELIDLDEVELNEDQLKEQFLKVDFLKFNSTYEKTEVKERKQFVLPKREEVFIKRFDLGKIANRYTRDIKFSTNKEIYDTVAREQEVNYKDVERGLKLYKYVDKHCPTDMKHDPRKAFNHFKSLTVNGLP